MALSDTDLERIVEKLREREQESLGDGTGFYVKPEEHYLDHQNLRTMYNDWKGIKDAFMKMMVGFILVGTVVMAIIGVVVEFAKDVPAKLLGH